MNSPINPPLPSKITNPVNNGLTGRAPGVYIELIDKETFDRIKQQRLDGGPVTAVDELFKKREARAADTSLHEDVALGQTLANAAIAQAGAAATPEWKKVALDAVLKAARTHRTFTTDEVWAIIGTVATTAENRAMGAVMREAAKQGLCSVTSTTRKTTRASNHRRPLTVWMSSIYSTRGRS